MSELKNLYPRRPGLIPDLAATTDPAHDITGDLIFPRPFRRGRTAHEEKDFEETYRG